MKKVTLSILTILFTFSLAYSQLSIEDLDMSKIPQRKIRSYINMQKENNIVYMSDFKASCYSGMNLSECNSMMNTYFVEENPDSLWSLYRNTSVSESWNGKKVSFGLLYSKNMNNICYNDEYYSSGVDTGQVFFVNLKLLKGILNLPVGIEVVKVSSESKTITFSYLDGNKSQGEQIIHLEATPDGFTKIIHVSNFKSDSDFRDKRLYPFFHTRVINDFHRNMARNVSDEKIGFKVLRTTN